MLVSVEVALGIICGSLPSIRPILLRHSLKNRRNNGWRGLDARNTPNERRQMQRLNVWEVDETLATGDEVVDLHPLDIEIKRPEPVMLEDLNGCASTQALPMHAF